MPLGKTKSNEELEETKGGKGSDTESESKDQSKANTLSQSLIQKRFGIDGELASEWISE